MEINTVLLEITDKCNLNCTHCMNRPDYIGIETDVIKIDNLLSKLDGYKAKKVYLSGGEPFVHTDICEIIKLCCKYPLISFVITTNGLLLTPQLMQLIAGQKNITMQFSIDGVTADVYESIRGKNTFKTFTEKIKIWDSSSIKQGLARTCINKYNFKEIPLIYRYCLEHRLLPSFIFVSSLGKGKENWNQLELNMAQKIWCIDTINKLNDQYNMNITPPEAPATCNFTENTGVGSLIIRANGSVSPCQYFYNDSIGNVYEDELEAIFNSPWIKEHCKIAEKRKNILEKSQKCLSCKIHEGCNYGCIGIANDLGNILGYDGLCDLRIITTICYSNKIIRLNQQNQKGNTVHILQEENNI